MDESTSTRPCREGEPVLTHPLLTDRDPRPCGCDYLAGNMPDDVRRDQGILHDTVIDVLNDEYGISGLLWLNEHLDLAQDGEEREFVEGAWFHPLTLVDFVNQHNFENPAMVSRIVGRIKMDRDNWRRAYELLEHVKYLRDALRSSAVALNDTAAKRWTVAVGWDRD